MEIWDTDAQQPHDDDVQDHGERDCQHHTIRHQARDYPWDQEALLDGHSRMYPLEVVVS